MVYIVSSGQLELHSKILSEESTDRLGTLQTKACRTRLAFPHFPVLSCYCLCLSVYIPFHFNLCDVIVCLGHYWYFIAGFPASIIFFCFYCFDTGSHYVSLAVLELTMCRPHWSITQQSTCLCLPSDGIMPCFLVFLTSFWYDQTGFIRNN